MEFISELCGMLCLFCIVAAPITFVIGLILLLLLLINRKKKKKTTYIILSIIGGATFFSTLGGIILFTIIGVATFEPCEHNWETIVETEATCTENGSIVTVCTLCDSEKAREEISATGHKWEESIKESTCTEQGERTKKCASCGGIETEIIDAHHNYIETTVSEPKCEDKGKVKSVCAVCGDIQEKTIPATGHVWGEEITVAEPKCEKEGVSQTVCITCGSKENKAIAATGHDWVKATCTNAKTCSACGATEGEPIGHTTDAGLCSRCNKTVMKQSPVTVVGMRYTIDYVGGVEWTFKIRNNSDKVIKYVTFQWSCYNAVGDAIRDEISNKSYVRIKFTGPLAPGKTSGSKRNASLFYNHDYAYMKWNEITVEYMDGTTETITEYYEGYQEK